MTECYVIRAGRLGPIKVGRAVDVGARIAQLQTGCPFDIELVAVFAYGGVVERRLHKLLSPFRMRGEWFTPAAAPTLNAYIARSESMVRGGQIDQEAAA